jgi:hypothetical protein
MIESAGYNGEGDGEVEEEHGFRFHLEFKNPISEKHQAL